MESFLQHSWHFQHVIQFLDAMVTARLIFASKHLLQNRKHIGEFEIHDVYKFPLRYLNKLSGLKKFVYTMEEWQNFDVLMHYFTIMHLPKTLEHFAIKFCGGEICFTQYGSLNERFVFWSKKLSTFKNLKTLCLKHACLEDIQFVSAMPQLQELDISDNYVEDFKLSVLSQMQNLQILDVSNNKIQFLAIIPFPFTLRKLFLSGNKISDDGVYSLRYLIHLVLLKLDGLEFISEKGLKKFEFPVSLKVLSLRNTLYRPNGLETEIYGCRPFTFTFLKPLKKLTSLYLSLNKLRTADIRNLILPNTLKQLCLEENDLDKSSKIMLKKKYQTLYPAVELELDNWIDKVD